MSMLSTTYTNQEKPAQRVIRLLGVIDLAYACRVTTSGIHKWAASRGGLIPSQHQAAVLRLAREKGVDLTAEHLIGEPAPPLHPAHASGLAQ
jgi:PP-loop superfamily ATP-utilizing enzyme